MDRLMYLWHFLSDKEIGKLYDILEYEVKKRRRDFDINPITSTFDRISRETYGREDWLEEEMKTVLPFEYNNGNFPHTNSTPLNSEKELIYMKATGIVRRIDDLGRIVIPKEIRRTLRIRESDPLEIFTDREGEIILKKYSPIGEMTTFAKQYAESLAQVSGHAALIADRDQFIAISGGYKTLLGKGISKQLEEKIGNREIILASRGDRSFITVSEEQTEEYQHQAIAPIICEGDVIGAVVLLESDNKSRMGEVEQKLILSAAGFLGRQMEQ